MRPSPKGLKMGEILGSAFSMLRQLEAAEGPDRVEAHSDTAAATKAEPSPTPIAGRFKLMKRRLRFSECACLGTKTGCCSATTPPLKNTGGGTPAPRRTPRTDWTFQHKLSEKATAAGPAKPLAALEARNWPTTGRSTW